MGVYPREKIFNVEKIFIISKLNNLKKYEIYYNAKMKWIFKEEKSFEERLKESARVRSKFPNRIPVTLDNYEIFQLFIILDYLKVIVEKRPESTLPVLINKKFLVESNSTCAQFLYTVRKRIPELDSHESVFFYINKNVVILTSQMDDLYEVI
jgi:GABA(A) receptor-associated protein